MQKKKKVFLRNNLEEIYMDIPSSFKGNMRGNKVCRLKKTPYGLKQSPKAWFRRFSKVVFAIGYRQSHGDDTLFIKHSNAGGVTTLLLYVNDKIVTRNDEKEKEALRRCLVKEFETKELGILK